MKRMLSVDGVASETFHVYIDTTKCFATESFMDALEIVICLYALFNLSMSPLLKKTYTFILDFIGLKPSDDPEIYSVREKLLNCDT